MGMNDDDLAKAKRLVTQPTVNESGVCPYCNLDRHHHTQEQIDQCWDNLSLKRQYEERAKEEIGKGRVSEKFGQQTFDNSKASVMNLNRESWINAAAWIFTDSVGLYMWGDPGVGKTYAARSVLFQAMKDGKSINEITAHKMLKMSKLFGMEFFISYLERVKYLMIDDIDKADWDSKALTFFWSLLNERSNNSCRTIITSNVAPDNFRSIFSGAVMANDSKVESATQRLHPITTLEFTGESVRGKNV